MVEDNGTSAEKEKTPFKYVFGEKDDVIVVLFSGKMSSADTVIFESCGAELATKNQAVILISFAEVEHAAVGVLSAFAKFQKNIRDQGKHLALCGVNLTMKAQFQASGIIREAELFPSIPAAWQVLKGKARLAPAAPGADSGEGLDGETEKKTA